MSRMIIHKSKAEQNSLSTILLVAVAITAVVMVAGLILGIIGDAREFTRSSWETARRELEQRLNSAWR